METAKFWTSSWLNDVSPAAMFPNLYKHSRRKNKSVAYAMANDNWIRDIMHDITRANDSIHTAVGTNKAAEFNGQD
jgi:hypothetical protein